jgi:hypothetical protein
VSKQIATISLSFVCPCVRVCVFSTFNSIMGMGSLAATAIEVLMQSWGEFNVSLVAALSVMLLAGVLHQAIMLKDNDKSSSTTNPESKGRLQDDILPTPLKIQNNEEFVVDDPAIATSSTDLPQQNSSSSSSFIYLIRVCTIDSLVGSGSVLKRFLGFKHCGQDLNQIAKFSPVYSTHG